MDYKNLAQIYKTPLYIYDFNKISFQYNALKSAFAARKSLICYAVKANSNLSILKFLSNLGAGFDCVSIGEIKKALLAGGKNYQIIFSGVGKQKEELEFALREDILFINVESFEELKSLENIAKSLQKIARISVRVNPNVNPKTHPYISTGLKENKFGVSIDEARQIYLYAKNSAFLNPIAIHFHIGSQICDISPIFEAAKIVAKFTKELEAAKIDIKFFDIGGGIGVKYEDEKEPNLYDYAQGILSALQGQDKTIILEPGRFIMANSGYFLTKVIYTKTNENHHFAVIDGGMNDFIRPSLYGAKHQIIALNDEKEEQIYDIVGPICESGDFFAKNIKLPKLKSDDLILIKGVGAYGYSMSSNYNSRLKPAQIALIDDKIKLIAKRQTFDDLILCEIDYLKEQD